MDQPAPDPISRVKGRSGRFLLLAQACFLVVLANEEKNLACLNFFLLFCEKKRCVDQFLNVNLT